MDLPDAPSPPDVRPLLTARWQHLAMLNYSIDPRLLESRVPVGTELDTWRGEAIVSLVGFRFLDTRVLGVAIPGHRDFDEVNLRFYVRRRGPDGAWRRGVVFAREIVPRWLIATVARWGYDEPYVSRPMRHHVDPAAMLAGTSFRVDYQWKDRGLWNVLSGTGTGHPGAFAPGSEAGFITEHYWGYTRLAPSKTAEYRVDHPPWRAWALHDAHFTGDARHLYGKELAAVVTGTPRSAFLAEGSEVSVFPSHIIEQGEPDWPAA